MGSGVGMHGRLAGGWDEALTCYLLPALKTILATEFSVYHTTFQFETVACAHTNDGCNYVAAVYSDAAASRNSSTLGHPHSEPAVSSKLIQRLE